MEKILGVFPSIKLPDEIHKVILTEKKFISIFVRKLKMRRLSALALAGLLGIAYPFEVGSILASRKIEIKDLNEEIKSKNATVFYWEQIKKISIDGWYNMVKIKVDGKKYKYVFNDDDFAAFIEVLRKTKKSRI